MNTQSKNVCTKKRKFMDVPVIFETGALTYEVHVLILFANNTRRLAEMRDSIYIQYNKGTQKPKILINLLDAFFKEVKESHLREFKDDHTIKYIGKKEVLEFISIYVKKFEVWKKELSKKPLRDDELCKQWAIQIEESGIGETLFFKGKDLFTIEKEELVARIINEEVVFIFSSTKGVKIYEIWILIGISENTTHFKVKSFDNSKNIKEYKSMIRLYMRRARRGKDRQLSFNICVRIMETTLLYFEKLAIPLDDEMLQLQEIIASGELLK